jgi:hypothetical protein
LRQPTALPLKRLEKADISSVTANLSYKYLAQKRVATIQSTITTGSCRCAILMAQAFCERQ